MAQGLYLSQKMSLQQVLAPQLQQSLALLQAPTLELQALVQQELAANVVLEEVPEEERSAEEKDTKENGETSADPTEPPADVTFDPATEKPNGEPVDDFQVEFEKLTQMDQEWRDHFNQTNLPMRERQEDEEKRQFMFDSLQVHHSLQDELQEQLRSSDFSDEQRAIAEEIIGNIDERGYLQATVEEMAMASKTSVEQVEAVLKLIQSFDPPGVAARDLRECLLLQLERKGEQDALEYQVIRDHMDLLQKRQFPAIASKLGLYVDEIQDAAENIGKLDPRPGRAYAAEEQQYVMPEVFVQKDGDEYIVTNNNEQIPHLRISNSYKDLMADSGSSPEVREYIREKIRAGKFLIKSIHQRQETILNIAREIVKRQREFMDNGTAFLKPMIMAQIAEVVGVHETTVSRAVSGKFIQTPQGVFEMKYFFTSGLQTSSGEGMSNTSVKDIIAGLLKDEDSAKPMSDAEIVKLLTDRGIKIARRTVAKYRSELNILPSNLRKVY